MFVKTCYILSLPIHGFNVIIINQTSKDEDLVRNDEDRIQTQNLQKRRFSIASYATEEI